MTDGIPLGFKPHPGDFLDRHKGTHRSTGSKHRRAPSVFARTGLAAVVAVALAPALFLIRPASVEEQVQSLPRWEPGVSVPVVPSVPARQGLKDRPKAVRKPRHHMVPVAQSKRWSAPEPVKTVPELKVIKHVVRVKPVVPVVPVEPRTETPEGSAGSGVSVPPAGSAGGGAGVPATPTVGDTCKPGFKSGRWSPSPSLGYGNRGHHPPAAPTDPSNTTPTPTPNPTPTPQPTPTMGTLPNLPD